MVQFDENRLAEYCRKNGIVRLRMFGSAARGEERPDSDVDLIADFGVPIGVRSSGYGILSSRSLRHTRTTRTRFGSTR